MNRCAALLLATFFSALGLGNVEARAWKPQGLALAQDYSVITDVRPSHDIITVLWFAPPLAPSSPTAQAVLDRYIIIGASHVKQDTVSGQMESTPLDTIQVSDSDEKPLTLLEGDKIPPTVSGVISGMGGVMRQSMGVVGTGMRFFAYESGSVHACSKGRLSISYVGETYTYDTPMPGCPAP